MRVKLIVANATSISRTEIVEISNIYVVDDSNLIYLQVSNEEIYSYQSTKPLNYFDVDSYERWLDQLLVNGYVDLTNSGYEFELDEEVE